MGKIFDVLADEYIDKEDMDINAPPERYQEIDDFLLVNNAVKWIVNELCSQTERREE